MQLMCSRYMRQYWQSQENIKAKYDNGILTVVVPKYREEEKPLKRIAVE